MAFALLTLTYWHIYFTWIVTPWIWFENILFAQRSPIDRLPPISLRDLCSSQQGTSPSSLPFFLALCSVHKRADTDNLWAGWHTSQGNTAVASRGEVRVSSAGGQLTAQRSCDEICTHPRYYTAPSGNSIPTFRDNLSVYLQDSRSLVLWLPDPLKKDFLTLEDGTDKLGCTETSARNYHSTLRHILEECRSNLYCDAAEAWDHVVL